MDITTIGVPVVVFTIIYALIKLVEWLVKKNKDKETEQPLYYKLDRIYELVTKLDEEGTPLIFVPRSLSKVQEDITKALTEIIKVQIKQTDILERLERLFEKKMN